MNPTYSSNLVYSLGQNTTILKKNITGDYGRFQDGG
jgi:hypothetical protein